MYSELKITKTTNSRLASVDFDSLGFGNVFSDHMFSLHYENGAWQRPEILPYGTIEMEPGTATLHYGQSVFEGLKAFLGQDEVVRIFRPDRNAKRFISSCERLCIPTISEDTFIDAIESLVALDLDWIPRRRGQAFYIRPLVFGTEAHLEVRPSQTYRFIIMTSPVRAYFDAGMSGVALQVEETFTRSAPGGMGAVKTAGNYAASLYPTEQGAKQGLAQALWLDAVEHKYVEEVGAMNIFFRIDGTIVTPDLRGTILPGITRESVITLLQEEGHRIEQRRIEISEVVQAIQDGSLDEAFGAGTAAIIAPVGRLNFRDQSLTVNDNQAGPVTRWLYDQLTGIQLGEIPDRHNWNHVVDLSREIRHSRHAESCQRSR